MISVTDVMDQSHPMSLEPDWDGSCACGEIEGDGFRIETDCWRVHDGGCAVYVDGSISREDKMILAMHVAANTGWRSADWYIYVDGARVRVVEGS